MSRAPGPTSWILPVPWELPRRRRRHSCTPLAEAAVSADAVIHLLEDPEGPVRGLAAEALGRIGTHDPAHVRALEASHEKERHPFARWAMGKALEKLREE